MDVHKSEEVNRHKAIADFAKAVPAFAFQLIGLFVFVRVRAVEEFVANAIQL